MPGYVLVMAAVLGTLGDGTAAYVTLYALNVLTSLAALLLLYLLTAELLSKSTARIALLIGAVAPPLVASTATFGGTPWVHLVMLAALMAVHRAVRGDGGPALRERFAQAGEADGREARVQGDAGAPTANVLWRFALAGLLTGVWALFRGEAVGAAVLITVWMLLQDRGGSIVPTRSSTILSGPRRFTRPAIYLFTVILTILPWTVRNTVVFDRVVPMTTNFWLNAWRGNHAGTTGGAFKQEGGSNWLTPEIRAAIEALPRTPAYELEIMEIYRERTRDFVAAHPGRALALYAQKLAMFVTIDWSDPRARHPLYLWPQLLLTLFAAAGGVLLMRRGRFPWLPALVVAVTMLTVAALHVETRYQLMMGILYIVFAAAAVEAAAKRMFPERFGLHG